MKVLATIISLCIFIALFLISTSKTVQGLQNLTTSFIRVISNKKHDPNERLSNLDIPYGNLQKLIKEPEDFDFFSNCIFSDKKNNPNKRSIVQDFLDTNNSKRFDNSQELNTSFNNTSISKDLRLKNINN